MKTMGAILAAVMVAGAGWGQDTVQGEVGVDLLAVREDGGIAKHFKANWGKYLTGLLTAVAVDRVAAHNDELWYRRDDDKQTLPPPSNTAVNDNDFADVTVIAGDNSPVTVRIEYIEAAGK